ncbi:type II toxin-antitoxin system MqsR family toxin [Flavobacterium branchiarum]|uniref:Type II toxin-antitoxin system MqsR family toxin n=1 Tax=Flavobacterium branchiarum TaxID=1114870 RepID=A0ABV5FPS3_9FLAO|nr:type II toxin-antitoxin system MqsR family toxin [Flavobacterium branchiarum]MDN3675612.1 type II toxin-antitoxin system MqsR family toxin [Flavobacterium branchiarum]
MVLEREVKIFLSELKQFLKIWPIVFLHRPKNSLQNLADIGITAKRRLEIILDLEIEDYSQGPLSETQQNGTAMWVFGKVVKKTEVYIKLTVNKDSNHVICISFHIAEDTMNYPLKVK